MRIAITGGTGFVGTLFSALLRARGHEVVLISRGIRTPTERNAPFDHRLSGSVRTAPVGLGEVGALVNAFEGCDAVAHLAGINREIGTQSYQRVHIEGTANVIRAAQEAGVPHLACLSFLRARPECGSPYHESKWQVEELVRASGIAATIIKAGVIYGYGDHMVTHLSQTLRTSRLFGLVGFREQLMAPVAGEDIARILYAATVERRLDGMTVPVIGPEPMTLREAVTRVGEAVGVRPLFVPLPVAAHHLLGELFELLMTVPLVAKAQVRILSEDLTVPLPSAPLDTLPHDLVPMRRFNSESIHAALPERHRFGAEDFRLRLCGCRGKPSHPG